MIQNIKRAQSVLNKCNPPSGVWSESYRHEIRLTSELMLIAARVGRAIINSRQYSPDIGTKEETNRNQQASSDEVKNNVDDRHSLNKNLSEKMENLPSTFRTDIANK